MVVFVDLDDETEPPEHGISEEQWAMKRIDGDSNAGARPGNIAGHPVQTRSNPNRNALTQAMGCYPYDSILKSNIQKIGTVTDQNIASSPKLHH